MATTFARFRRNLRSGLLLPVIAFAASACVDPPVFLPSYQPGGPQGVLGGTPQYVGDAARLLGARDRSTE